MKHFAAKLPKYFEPLIGAVLVLIVVQYALITGVLKMDHPVSGLLQLGFYLLLAVAVYRGITQRSRLAWLVVQMMLIALFFSSLLFAVVCAVLAMDGGELWILLLAALLTAVVNGLLTGFLFSMPTSAVFTPKKDDQ